MQKGSGISKVIFYRSGGDVWFFSRFKRDLLEQVGGSHNHTQFRVMFRNLNVHPGNKRLGKPGGCFFFFNCSVKLDPLRLPGARGSHTGPHPQHSSSALFYVYPHTEVRLWSIGEAASILPGPEAAPCHWGWRRKWARGWGRGRSQKSSNGSPSIPTQAEEMGNTRLQGQLTSELGHKEALRAVTCLSGSVFNNYFGPWDNP